ncbi:MAG: hypothetical protein QG646_1355, partial [Euryarchaeota archaeon]|nr:hypothetical protein [Euryarchaeota archaeon]
MTDFIKDCEKIDVFLKIAQTVDTFQHCHTVYELFGITNKNEPYPDIEKKIEAFERKYAGSNAPKFKNFGKTLSGDAAIVKRILKDHRREYNEYLKENDPRIQKIREHFEFCSKRDKELDSDEKAGLIDEGKEAGLTETEVRSLIAKWEAENGVKEVETRSGDSSSPKPFTDFLNKTYYEVLGVPEDADYAQIKEAYEKEYQKYNTSRDKAKASARFFVVSEAW